MIKEMRLAKGNYHHGTDAVMEVGGTGFTSRNLVLIWQVPPVDRQISLKRQDKANQAMT